MRKYILVLLMLILPTVGWSATYYVNATGGNDSRSTAQAQDSGTPWLTIQKCADNVVAGDTCSAVVTGTATASITKGDVVAGSKTISITLTGDTWITA
jgi:hypothetical protein